MPIDIQLKIKSNPNYLRYLREHSEWYRILNRDPSSFKRFESTVKETYKLRTTDRIAKTLDTIELVQNLLTSLK